MKKYALLYSKRKEEDNIILTNMFPNNYEINIGLTEMDINRTKKLIDQLIESRVDEFIFGGLEEGWDKLVKYIKEKDQKCVKVICNTQDSLLYDEYEREHFFKLLKLNKEGLVDVIGFLRKGQYELYNSLGYKCFYLKENFVLDKEEVKVRKARDNKRKDLGVFALSYVWNKNIFNQLCIAKMLDGWMLRFNNLNERMTDFLDKMKINNEEMNVKVNVEGVLKAVKSVDVVVSSEFTDYVHPVFFLAMESGIPCLVSNTVDFLDDKKLVEEIVTTTEDNPIINASKVEEIYKNKDEIIKNYREWKKKYNVEAKKNIDEFIEL